MKFNYQNLHEIELIVVKVKTFATNFDNNIFFQLNNKLKICEEKLNKYEPVSVVNEEEFQVNNEVACSSHNHPYNSCNELPSTSDSGFASTFGNEVPFTKAQSTIEAQQCDEISSNSFVTFDRVVSINNEFHKLNFYLQSLSN